MQILRYVLCVIFTGGFAATSQAEKNYWHEINTLKKQGVNEYFSGLTSEELIVAARQCSQEIQKKAKPEEWDVVSGGYLSFIYQYYPRKTSKQEMTSLLQHELKDKSQSIVWRRFVMHMLGSSWSHMLSVEQCHDTAKIMYDIYRDDSESIYLRPSAIKDSTILLSQAYLVNILGDPSIRQLLKQKEMKRQELVDMVQSGSLELSDGPKQKSQKIQSEIEVALEKQISLFSAPGSDIDIKKQILNAWGRYHRSGLDNPRVQEALTQVIENYKQCDSDLWLTLARTAIEDFKINAAQEKLNMMIEESKDENNKKRLIRLKKSTEKKEEN